MYLYTKGEVVSKKRFQFPEDFWRRCYTQDGCILFTGTPSAEYGRYRGEQAHRYSYRIHHGEIPEGAVIHHTCFCKRCVNPAHLQAITQQENINENVRSGRLAHFNKLTPKQVIDIVRSDLSEAELAEKYSVSRTTIRRIQKL
jgi:hypothetical protein